MKTTLIAFCILISLNLLAQKEKDLINDVYYSPEKKVEISFNPTNLQQPEIELAWLKTNLKNYHQERKLAFIMQITGMAASTSAFFLKNEEHKKIAAGVGLVFSISGTFTLLSAERHLKLASQPVPNE